MQLKKVLIKNNESWHLIGRGTQDVADAAPVAQSVVHHRDEAHQEGVASALFVPAASISVFVLQSCETISKMIVLSCPQIN